MNSGTMWKHCRVVGNKTRTVQGLALSEVSAIPWGFWCDCAIIQLMFQEQQVGCSLA